MSKKTSSKSSEPMSAMAALLAKHESKFVALKKGESLNGKITKIDKHEILVDVGAKTDATVMEKDKRNLSMLLEMFKVGDVVEVNVLNPESDTGQGVVSLRRYIGKMAWGKLDKYQKSKEQIEVTITEIGKAGFVVATEFGVSGFLPQSHTSFGKDVAIGNKIKVSVLEVNREDNKIIFSQKTTLSDEEFVKIAKKYKVDQKVKVTVSNITPFGLFVSIEDGIEGFIHISEASWERQDDLTSEYDAGDEIEAVITRFDSETKRINLSIKRLTKDPFEESVEAFPIDKKVKGTIKSIDDVGVAIYLGDSIEGFIKKEKIPPTMTIAAGQEIELTVASHDKRKHRIILTPVLKEKPIGYR